MNDGNSLATQIIYGDSQKKLDIGNPPEFWSAFNNEKSDDNGEYRLWQWFMDFSPHERNSVHKYFITRGAGKNCHMKAIFVSINIKKIDTSIWKILNSTYSI